MLRKITQVSAVVAVLMSGVASNSYASDTYSDGRLGGFAHIDLTYSYDDAHNTQDDSAKDHGAGNDDGRLGFDYMDIAYSDTPVSPEY